MLIFLPQYAEKFLISFAKTTLILVLRSCSSIDSGGADTVLHKIPFHAKLTIKAPFQAQPPFYSTDIQPPFYSTDEINYT
jgi:hypothetical protein